MIIQPLVGCCQVSLVYFMRYMFKTLSSYKGNKHYTDFMNVISKRTLVKFYEEHAQAKTPLEVWHSDVRKVEWKAPDDIRKVYASASFLKV